MNEQIFRVLRIEATKDGEALVTFEDGESLRLDPSVIADCGISKGLELSQDEYDLLSGMSSAKKTKQRALRMLGMRSFSENELRERLRQKGEGEAEIDITARWLLEMGLLDDEKYAHDVVQRYVSKGYGAAKLKEELFKRRVPREYWDEALAAVETDEDKVLELLNSKLRGQAPDRDDMRRAQNFLLRRGFSYGEVSRAMSRYMEIINED